MIPQSDLACYSKVHFDSVTGRILKIAIGFAHLQEPKPNNWFYSILDVVPTTLNKDSLEIGPTTYRKVFLPWLN